MAYFDALISLSGLEAPAVSGEEPPPSLIVDEVREAEPAPAPQRPVFEPEEGGLPRVGQTPRPVGESPEAPVSPPTAPPKEIKALLSAPDRTAAKTPAPRPPSPEPQRDEPVSPSRPIAAEEPLRQEPAESPPPSRPEPPAPSPGPAHPTFAAVRKWVAATPEVREESRDEAPARAAPVPGPAPSRTPIAPSEVRPDTRPPILPAAETTPAMRSASSVERPSAGAEQQPRIEPLTEVLTPAVNVRIDEIHVTVEGPATPTAQIPVVPDPPRELSDVARWNRHYLRL